MAILPASAVVEVEAQQVSAVEVKTTAVGGWLTLLIFTLIYICRTTTGRSWR